MHIYGIVASIIIALLLTLIFSTSYRHRGPWGGLLFFFLVIFLASWAGQLWIPRGPVLFGVAWVPLVFIGVLVAILLLAAGSSAIDRAPVNPPAEKIAQEDASILAIGFFFWLLILILIIAITVGYWVLPETPGPL
jgi:hypothetical protein